MIPKEKLEAGAYYQGICRNASIARWDGSVFHHWRTKFAWTFLETISCPEDEDEFDVFTAERKIDDIHNDTCIIKEIPLDV